MNKKPANKTQEQLKSIFEYYRNGRLNDAEKLARSITRETPSNANGWKALWAILQKTRKTKESLTVIQKAAEISPSDAKVCYSLGYTFLELGNLVKAEETFRKAIALKPDYAEAYHYFGVTIEKQGKLEEAEIIFTKAIGLNPNFYLSHYHLAGILHKQNRLNEAENFYRHVIKLKPGFAEAHSILGIVLQEQWRLDEAEVSYKQAIALKPDFAEFHYILGITLKRMDRLDEAKASYNQAIALKPDFAKYHDSLGTTLKRMGRLDKAEASYNQAIALKPDYAEAHSNLGITLQELGRLDEAEASYRQAIVLKPDFAEAMLYLSFTQRYMNNLKAESVSLQNVLQIDSDDYGLRASVNLAICNFLEGNFTESKKHLLAATKIQGKTSSASKNERVYWRYLSNILKWHENKYLGVKKVKNDKILYVVGESHSLTSHHLCIQNSGFNFFCSARLIKGCKQWHLGNAFRNKYKHQFETIFSALPKHSYVLLAIGEIDCRLDTGIIVHKRKFPEKQIKEIISNTIENYLTYIENTNFEYQHNVTIQGVPCPNLDVKNHSERKIRQLRETINIFNYELKKQSNEKGFGFLDTYQLTNKGDGMSNGSWHIDDYHLSPDGMQEAWRRYGSEKLCEQ